MTVEWEGYEFFQDKKFIEAYCKHKRFALLDFQEFIGYSKKILNIDSFVKIMFPRVEDSKVLYTIENSCNLIFTELYSTKRIKNLEIAKVGHTIVIDLNKSEQELWDSLNKKKRNAIRQAHKRGVKVELADDEEEFEEWWGVYESTVKRKNFSKNPKGLLKEVFLFKNSHFFASKVNGQIASAALILKEGNNIYWWIGGTNLKFQRYRPNDALHWEIIKWGIGEGFGYYDMVGVVLEGAHGPTRFKLGFNGEFFKYYMYHISNHKILKKFIKFGLKTLN